MTSNVIFGLMKAGFTPAQIQAMESAQQGQAYPIAQQGQAYPMAQQGQAYPMAQQGQAYPMAQQGQAIDYQKLVTQLFQAGQATQLPAMSQSAEQINANMYASMIGLEIPGDNNFNLPAGVNPVGPNASY